MSPKAWSDRLKTWQKNKQDRYAKLIMSPPEKVTVRRTITAPAVILIMGMRGAGKSGLAYWLMDKYHREKHMGGAILFPGGKLVPSKAKLLPKWIKVVGDIKDFPKKSICLIDEAAQQAHARRTQSTRNINMDNLVSMARQRNQLMLFIAHHSRKLDINIITDSTRVIWKQPTEAHTIFEREEMRDFAWKAFDYFDKLKPSQRPKHCLVMNFTKLSFGYFTNTLPKWWSEGLSKLWS